MSKRAALIVGGGLAGMSAALKLAELGVKVYLIEEKGGIGGSLHLLERTFPTDACLLCNISPQVAAVCPSLECDAHPNVEIVPDASLEEIEGEVGDFRVSVLEGPRYIDVSRCDLCGLCLEACPVERPGTLGGRFEPGKAIYRRPSRAVPSGLAIDRHFCTLCGECAAACPRRAIDLGAQARVRELQVGTILLAPGYVPYDARLKPEYGYGRLENVVTSLEFEYMLGRSSPGGGRPWRPSDGQMPKKLAFVQCVGSREPAQGWGYCSAICCMHTAKQARLAAEALPEAEIHIFSIDVRALGKGGEAYQQEAEANPRIHYRRGLPSAFEEGEGGKLRARVMDGNGRVQEETFDMAVLAVGLGVPPAARALAQKLGLELDEYGFCASPPFYPYLTSRPGIFAAGAFREPKDIAETVVESCAAAAEMAELLALEEVTEKGAELPPARDISDEEPRIGVFVCTCGGQLGEALDLEELKRRLKKARWVVEVKEVDELCRGQGWEAVEGLLVGGRANRILIAGCSHRLLARFARQTLRRAGFAPTLWASANLLGECIWVNAQGAERLLVKCTRLVEMAAASLRRRPSQAAPITPLTQGCLVVGGGAAGLVSALTLARLGQHVHLVERETELGGNLLRLHRTLEGGDPAELLASLVERVKAHPQITLHLATQIEEISGHPGRYITRLTGPLGDGVIEHGAVILATGGREAGTQEYLYGSDSRILTQEELEHLLAQGGPEPLESVRKVVMIQCVGSRGEERSYCSRICCAQAIKNALYVKELAPEADIFILYRDIRTFGLRERYYQEARERGVLFLRYEADRKPQVEAIAEGLRIAVNEADLNMQLQLEADLLVLATGIEPAEARTLAAMLGVSLDGDGFFAEEDAKTRSFCSGLPGVYLCGLAQSPRFLAETMAQAKAAALEAALYLRQVVPPTPDSIAVVNARLCKGCQLCVEACPYGARTFDPETGVVQVDEYACRGCGICVAVCPNGASSQPMGQLEGIMSAIDAAL